MQWGYVYFVCSVLAATASFTLVSLKLGRARPVFKRSAAEFRDGLYFSVGLSAQTIYNDIDKTMLVRLGTLDATGIYGAAYRLIDVSFAPILALLSAAYPNFFRAGHGGVASTLSYAKPLLKKSVGYAALISIMILLFAGLVPYVLGSEYARTTEALRWLAPLPILKAMHYFLSDALTGAGHQGLRSGIQASVAPVQCTHQPLAHSDVFMQGRGCVVQHRIRCASGLHCRIDRELFSQTPKWRVSRV